MKALLTGGSGDRVRLLCPVIYSLSWSRPGGPVGSIRGDSRPASADRQCLPAMLKGWLDRVWVPVVAFRLGPGAIQPLLTHVHRIGVVTTYGSPSWLLWFIGWPDRRMIGRGLRRLCARRCRLDWLELTNIDNRTTAERRAFLTKVQKRLDGWK
jgi:hypothetical protein